MKLNVLTFYGSVNNVSNSDKIFGVIEVEEIKVK